MGEGVEWGGGGAGKPGANDTFPGLLSLVATSKNNMQMAQVAAGPKGVHFTQKENSFANYNIKLAL